MTGAHVAERRSADPIAVLSRRMDALCTRAVDPAEIAAGLESAGYTDAAVAAEFGLPDVFALAEELYLRTPRVFSAQAREQLNPWRVDPARHLLRGLAYGLPGLILLAAQPAASGPVDRALLSLSAVLGWGWGQAMAYLGSLQLGRLDRSAARAVLAAGLVLALPAVAVVLLLGPLLGGAPRMAALAAACLGYLVAASVTMVLGSELWLLAVLAPAAVVTGIGYLVPARLLPWPGDQVVGVGALAAVLLVLAVAVALVLGGADPRRWRRERPRRPEIAPSEQAEAGWHLLYGTAAGLLVCTPTMLGVPVADGARALLPVVWSMGVVEWLLQYFRRGSTRLVNATADSAAFARRARRLAVTGAAIYVLVLAGLELAVQLAADATGAAAAAAASDAAAAAASGGLGPWVASAGGCLLGLVFYLALLDSTLGRIRPVASTLAATAALGLVAVAAIRCSVVPVQVPVAGVVLLVHGAAAVVLLLLTLRVVGDPTCHV